MRFVPALVVLVVGLALYVTRGVLDQILTGEGLIRVALLPPVQALGGFVALAALGLLWLDRRAVPRASATQVRPALGPLVLPLFGLLVLLLPYLPWLPDAVPAVQIIAGPLRAIVWLAVVMQFVWVLCQVRLLHADWLGRWTLRRAALAIGVATTLICGAAAARLSGTVLFPAGDEPHYLVIAQSLWRDGDLKIENNHARRDYREYYPLDLDPHYLTRGADGEIYSIHPIGMPVLIAPVYALGGYPAVVALFVLMAAAAAALMWHAVVRATNAIGAATFGWAAVAATTPFLYNSFAIYPEVPAALAVVVALSLTHGGAGPREAVTRWLGVGLACAALPWLSTKYAPMSAALLVVAAARIVWPAAAVPTRLPVRAGGNHLVALAALMAPYAVSLAGWFYFFAAIWGTPRPQAPYGDLVQTRPFNLIFGAPGLLFDQEYGLAPYAPVYVLAVTGLVAMWRSGGEMRRRAVEVALPFAALLGTVGAFRIWWGGSASPGRPLASGLLLLALPIAIAFRGAAAGSARRAAHHLLLWLSIGIALTLLLAQNGLLTANGRDGTSSLLEDLSPRWPAWTLVPSFIHHEAGTALLHVLGWAAIATLAALALARTGQTRPGAASLRALTVCFAALLTAALVIPWLPASPPWPGVDLRARPRVALLDAFDAVARPIGIEYSPSVSCRRPTSPRTPPSRSSRDGAPSRSRSACCTMAVSRCRPAATGSRSNGTRRAPATGSGCRSGAPATNGRPGPCSRGRASAGPPSSRRRWTSASSACAARRSSSEPSGASPSCHSRSWTRRAGRASPPSSRRRAPARPRSSTTTPTRFPKRPDSGCAASGRRG